MDEKIRLLHSQLNVDKKVTMYLPDMPAGDIDIVVIQKKPSVMKEPISLRLPRHHLGKEMIKLNRDIIYSNER